jgi:hypothetical protein
VSAILFKPEPVSVKWVNPENAPGKWLKVTTEQKKLNFFENLSKSFLKFKIIIDDIFIDKQTKLLIDRQIRYLEELSASVELRSKAYVSSVGDLRIYELAVLENNRQALSALKDAKILVDANYNEYMKARELYLKEIDVLFSNQNKFYIKNTPRIGKSIATENFPKVDIKFTNEFLLKIREFELAREKSIRIQYVKELLEAKKQGWSKFAIGELKINYLQELGSVYNEVSLIEEIKRKYNEWQLNIPKFKLIARERIVNIKVIDEIWLKNISPDK